MTADLAGAVILAVSALALAFFVLRRQRGIFGFAVALIVVGTGYLWATGAAGDVGKRLLPCLIRTSL